jgi:Rieske 2Fe-2S family protein
MEMTKSTFIIKSLAGSTEKCIGQLPVGDFFTPEYFALEKERIFKKSWMRISLEKEIPNVGDYVVKELEVCDTSLLIVRGRDKKVRAFHNVCSHRLNRVAYAPSGNTKTGFRCRYHSWNYGLDGKLAAVLEEHRFAGLVKEEQGLTEVGCETWEGFIFVNVDPQRTQTLREYMGDEIYNGFGNFFPHRDPVGRISSIMHANWKVCLDAFVETYHFSTVHAASASNIANSREHPNGRIDALRLHPKHRVVSAVSNGEHTPTYAEQLAAQFSNHATVAPDLTKTGTGFPPQVNPLKLPDWFSDILVVFPMSNIQPLGGFFITQDYWPISHDKTRWELTIYMDPLKNAADDVVAEYNRIFLRDAIREDLMNLAMVQSNLFSGAKQYQFLGNMEPMVGHSYQAVADQIGHG